MKKYANVANAVNALTTRSGCETFIEPSTFSTVRAPRGRRTTCRSRRARCSSRPRRTFRRVLAPVAIRPPTSPAPCMWSTGTARREDRPEKDEDQPPSPVREHQRSAKPHGQDDQAAGGRDRSRLEAAGDFVRPVQREKEDREQRRDGQCDVMFHQLALLFLRDRRSARLRPLPPSALGETGLEAEDVAGLARERLADRIERGESDRARFAGLEDREIGQRHADPIREIGQRHPPVVQHVVELDDDGHVRPSLPGLRACACLPRTPGPAGT